MFISCMVMFVSSLQSKVWQLWLDSDSSSVGRCDAVAVLSSAKLPTNVKDKKVAENMIEQ